MPYAPLGDVTLYYEEVAARIPGAELHIVQGGRHDYLSEFREEATRVVLDFLARHRIGSLA